MSLFLTIALALVPQCLLQSTAPTTREAEWIKVWGGSAPGDLRLECVHRKLVHPHESDPRRDHVWEDVRLRIWRGETMVDEVGLFWGDPAAVGHYEVLDAHFENGVMVFVYRVESGTARELRCIVYRRDESGWHGTGQDGRIAEHHRLRPAAEIVSADASRDGDRFIVTAKSPTETFTYQVYPVIEPTPRKPSMWPGPPFRPQ